MVDLHAHILPGMDDGSQSMEESLTMAQMAADSGVRAMAVTPHCNIPDVFDNYDSIDFRERFRKLQQKVKEENIPLELYIGMEVFIHDNLPELIQKRKIIPINEGRYLLVEFDFGESADWMRFSLEMLLHYGYTPLIAHPERYDVVQAEPELAYKWVQMGCALQVNKGSILGRFGRKERKTAIFLLEHQLVACVASDAHHMEYRTPYMEETADYLAERFGKECVQLLLYDNPYRILESEDIVLL